MVYTGRLALAAALDYVRREYILRELGNLIRVTPPVPEKAAAAVAAATPRGPVGTLGRHGGALVRGLFGRAGGVPPAESFASRKKRVASITAAAASHMGER